MIRAFLAGMLYRAVLVTQLSKRHMRLRRAAMEHLLDVLEDA